MDKERWQQIFSIVSVALKLREAERPAYLAQACSEDAELRAEVDAILRANDEMGSFLARPALEHVTDFNLTGMESTLTSPVKDTPRTVGAYRLLTLLGKGGMGEVHLAIDLRLRRKVAIKLLPAHFTGDSDRIRRFSLEARAVSALNHPNILTIHEIGQAPLDGEIVHYIATEFVDGETLRQRMTGPMSVTETLDLAVQITTALAAAHEVGIIHRDIKPENIMVRRDGLVKILDFGLAKLTEHQSEEGTPIEERDTLFQTAQPTAYTAPPSTMPGMILGTPRYMSPEQARGEKVDGRSDLFSLGVLLYEMLAGKPPFTGSSMMEIISQVLASEPAPLRSLQAQVPEPLELCIHRLLRKNREQRYAAIGELLADLKACRMQPATAASPAVPIPAFLRSGWLVGAAIALFLSLALWWGRNRLLAPTPQAPEPLRSEFSEMFLDLGRWNVPPSGFEVHEERLFIADQPIVGTIKNLAADDFTMTFHLRLENGKGAAWALRVRDEGSYYLFHLRAADEKQAQPSYFLTYIVRHGQLGEAVNPTPVAKPLIAGGEYSVSITAQGNEIRHYLNPTDDPSRDPLGDPLGYLKDDGRLYPIGGIGFRSVGAERFSVDELYIRPLTLLHNAK